MTLHRGAARTLAAPLLLLLVLTGCGGYEPTAVPSPTPSPAAPSSSAPPAPECQDPLRSYAPAGRLPQPGAMPAGSRMREIVQRGRLVAGVSADTYLLASRNPETSRIEGFDIDFVRAISQALFGSPDRYTLKVITAADRIPALQAGSVDVVVRNMTINCARWEEIAFSAEYYRSGQKVLVRKGSGLTGLDDLAGQRVCAPTGTSSLANLERLAPDATPVTAANHTGCLVLFQRGEVAAITGDDTVLAGLASQDPYAVVPQQQAFTQEPYGIGMPRQDRDLVRFVNGVLEQMRRDGSWQASYDRWLAPTLGRGGRQPQPEYGR